ncbi:MAG: hypothetical protein ACKOTB_01160, partial [Planctomycetia bacterium]
MPADTPFDPCKQWLGFDAVHLGNHRLVLGLSPGADEGAVRRAADARIRLLESISPGPFELARNSLIKRIEESRDAVLAELVTSAAPGSTAGFAMPRPPSQLAAGSPPPPPDPWHAPPQVPGAVPPVPVAVAGQEQVVVRSTRYRKRTPFAGIAVTILALSVAVAALYWFKTNKHLLEKGKPAGRERVVARAEPEAPKPPPKRVPKKPDDEGPVDPTSDRAVSTGGRGPQRTPRPSAPSADEEPVEPLGTKPPASMTGKDPAAPQKKPSESMDDEKPARMVKPSEPKPDTKPGADSDDKPDAKPGMKPDSEPDSEPKPGTKPDGKPPTKEAMKEEMKDEPSSDDDPTPAPPDTAKLDVALKKVFALLQQQEHDAVEKGLEAAGEEYADKASRKRVNAWKQLAAYAKGYSGYRDEALETVAA